MPGGVAAQVGVRSVPADHGLGSLGVQVGGPAELHQELIVVQGLQEGYPSALVACQHAITGQPHPGDGHAADLRARIYGLFGVFIDHLNLALHTDVAAVDGSLEIVLAGLFVPLLNAFVPVDPLGDLLSVLGQHGREHGQIVGGALARLDLDGVDLAHFDLVGHLQHGHIEAALGFGPAFGDGRGQGHIPVASTVFRLIDLACGTDPSIVAAGPFDGGSLHPFGRQFQVEVHGACVADVDLTGRLVDAVLISVHG